ncbi:MAG: glycosyltransferase [Acidimicrobiales bacterium]
MSARGGRVAVVVSGFPRLSETFAVNELLALQRAGRLACVLATKPGDHGTVVSGCDQPGWGLLEPLTTVLSGDDAEQAEQAAEIVRATGGVDLVHGYFAHRPAAIAELTAATLGVPFSFSVHALDVRKVEPVELQRRAANARTVITCNADALATLRDLDIDAQLVPHGVDLDRFHPPASHREPGPSLRLLSVGRLVEKKGFRFLIEAMAAVDDRVRLEIVGDGPERSHLEQMIDDLELGDRVALVGRRSHDELPQLYRDADVVVVPSVIDSTGDREVCRTSCWKRWQADARSSPVMSQRLPWRYATAPATTQTAFSSSPPTSPSSDGH